MRIALIAVEVVLTFAAIILAVRWVVWPNADFEPMIVLLRRHLKNA